MKIQTKNLNGFVKRLTLFKAYAEDQLLQEKKDFVAAVFTDVVQGSPQWSGNLTSNWYIQINGASSPYRQIAEYSSTDWYREDPYQVGDDPAVSQTTDRELYRLNDSTLADKIKIANTAPYAAQVEAGEGPDGRLIRPENYKYGQIAMSAYVVTKYSALKGRRRIL